MPRPNVAALSTPVVVFNFTSRTITSGSCPAVTSEPVAVAPPLVPNNRTQIGEVDVGSVSFQTPTVVPM